MIICFTITNIHITFTSILDLAKKFITHHNVIMPLVKTKIHHISNVIQGIGANVFFSAKNLQKCKNNN
jgi:hypothetical protein